MPLPLAGTFFCTYGCFLKWWYPQNTPKWSFLVGKPMVVGYHHFGKPPYDNNLPGSECLVGHFSTLYTYYRYYWFNATTKNINTINTNADTKKKHANTNTNAVLYHTPYAKNHIWWVAEQYYHLPLEAEWKFQASTSSTGNFRVFWNDLSNPN